MPGLANEMAKGMETGLSVRLSRVIFGLLIALLLCAIGLASARADVSKTSFEQTGDLSRFDRVNVSDGSLAASTRQAYGSGTYSARAYYGGGDTAGYARGVFDVSWKSGEDVWYDAAFYLPVGFKAGQQDAVTIMRWDNWPTYGSQSDYGGIVISGGDHRARLIRGTNATGTRDVLMEPFDVPEGRWFFLQVHQRLGESNALNEVYFDAALVGRSTEANTYGRAIDRIRYGLVDVNQANPVALWFDRVIAKDAVGESGCPWAPSGAPMSLEDLIEPQLSEAFPPACWQPFDAAVSPFYQQIPDDPPIDPNSGEMVNRLFENGGFNPARAGIADTPSDYFHAFYYPTSDDPLYTVHGGSSAEPYAIDGKQLRVPVGARPAAGSDGGMSVVWDGYYWGFGGASVDDANRTITVSYGRKLRLGGDGLHAAETSSKWPAISGYVRYPELAAGKIDHALFFASSQVARSFVYPADASDGNDDPSLGYPPMGTHLQLDPSYMTDERLATYPPWKQAVLRAMRDYGFFLSDSTSSPIGSVRFESGSSFTSMGLPDPFVMYAQEHDIPSYFDVNLARSVYLFDLQSDVDWTKVRVIDPCQLQWTC
jgi:hypothetical protein